MAERLIDLSCVEFADVLAAKQSVPGGGGAAALVGALGVALCNMVGNFTTGKAAYADVEEDIQRMLAKGDEIRANLLQLVEDDAAAFEPLSRAYGIPKDDPTRAEVLEEATKAACVAPVEMMRQICSAIELLEEMGQKGSKMLISDVGCGALLCENAMLSAQMNVLINTKTLKDRAYAEALEAECDAMVADYQQRAKQLAYSIHKQIRGIE